jgi:small subunit ribosomal protein S20
MNKKQRNRKLVTQNKRNRMINRRYSSTVKGLTKLFQLKLKSVTPEMTTEEISTLIVEANKILSNTYSMIDKGVKKNVLHKNTAARKKSNLSKLFQTVNIK